MNIKFNYKNIVLHFKIYDWGGYGDFIAQLKYNNHEYVTNGEFNNFQCIYSSDKNKIISRNTLPYGLYMRQQAPGIINQNVRWIWSSKTYKTMQFEFF